ncbi:hypothetical protein HYU22_05040 [Candidatus Woesearchaeota archaeon]|nr:hypothetical protein [Candidatus Woesearchaeota archaeon]
MHLQRVKFKDIEQIPHINIQQNFKKDFFGTSPAPFIGRFGYPQVNIGVLSPQTLNDTSHYDSPRQWSLQRLPIGTIASLRYGLVNSRTSWNVKDIHKTGKFLEICQEVGMARKAVELEVRLKEQPKLRIKPEKEIIPFGPQAEVQKARITSNPAVDSRVERVVRKFPEQAAVSRKCRFEAEPEISPHPLEHYGSG